LPPPDREVNRPGLTIHAPVSAVVTVDTHTEIVDRLIESEAEAAGDDVAPEPDMSDQVTTSAPVAPTETPVAIIDGLPPASPTPAEEPEAGRGQIEEETRPHDVDDRLLRVACSAEWEGTGTTRPEYLRYLSYPQREGGLNTTIRDRAVAATGRVRRQLELGGTGTTGDRATLADARGHFGRSAIESVVAGVIINETLNAGQSNEIAELYATIRAMNASTQRHVARIDNLQALLKESNRKYDELERASTIAAQAMQRRQVELEGRIACMIEVETKRIQKGPPLSEAAAGAIQELMYDMLLDLASIMSDTNRHVFLTKYGIRLEAAPFNISIGQFLARCAGVPHIPNLAPPPGFDKIFRPPGPPDGGPPGGGSAGGITGS
jgi:hypothetical protein